MGYPGISSNFENGTKQLEAQLENGVAYKKNRVHVFFIYKQLLYKQQYWDFEDFLFIINCFISNSTEILKTFYL